MVKSESEVLDCPIWLMLINVVALEMLKAKLPHSLGKEELTVGSTNSVLLQLANTKDCCLPFTITASRQMKIPTPYLQLSPQDPQERV